MTADLETLVVAAYVFACELGASRGQAAAGQRRGADRARYLPGGDGDLLRSAVSGHRRQVVARVLPRLPSQSQYNRRLRALTRRLVWVQQRLSELLATEAVIADGTLLGVASYAGCAQKSEFAGLAAYGYCPSKEPGSGRRRAIRVALVSHLPVTVESPGDIA